MESSPEPADAATLERELRHHRFGPPDAGAVTPWDFIFQWPADYVRDEVWPVVSRLLVDSDAVVRARSIEFVRNWRDGASLTTPRLIDVAEQRTSLFGAEEVDGVALREMLAQALANRAPWNDCDRIAAALKKISADAPVGGGSAGIVACFDPQFAADKARKWGDAAFSWIEDAATALALFRRDALLSFLGSLTQMSAENRERILRGVEKFIKRDDATAAAIAKRDHFPSPTRPAPTVEDCRRAIGLA